jgi:hypothetical protein
MNAKVTGSNEEFRVEHAVVVIGADGLPLAPGTGSGDASAANQAAVFANPGSNASKANAVQGVAGALPILVDNAPLVLTPTVATATTGGTVAAGKKYVKFIFSSTFTGTVLGVAFVGGTDTPLEFPKLANGETYGAIVYTVTAGSVRIVAF